MFWIKTAISIAPLTCRKSIECISSHLDGGGTSHREVVILVLVTDLVPNSLDPCLVSKQGVHGHRVLYNQGCDGYERKHQHVKDEELLPRWS